LIIIISEDLIENRSLLRLTRGKLGKQEEEQIEQRKTKEVRRRHLDREQPENNL
jgi:hypothetical protein